MFTRERWTAYWYFAANLGSSRTLGRAYTYIDLLLPTDAEYREWVRAWKAAWKDWSKEQAVRKAQLRRRHDEQSARLMAEADFERLFLRGLLLLRHEARRRRLQATAA